MTTDSYLSEISKMSDRFGDKLLLLMQETHKPNLASITYYEAKTFYEKLVRDKESDK